MSARALVEAALRGQLTEAQAQRLYRLGAEAVTLALLAASKHIADQDARIVALEGKAQAQGLSPSTPSGMVPIHTKPNSRCHCSYNCLDLNKNMGVPCQQNILNA